MTDRINALSVVLEADIRDDDAKPLIDAIMQLKGVIAVEPHVATAMADHVARRRIRNELWLKLHELFWKDDP